MVTVAVKVTFWPKTVGPVQLNATAVLACVTDCVIELPLPMKLVSPL